MMKRGSALLVVLGMMAFIVVSAVAFSAYMRYARLPSSYLRRTSSSRLLVKGALAEAIDVIDRAIGNNPYPGVGGGDANRWQNRVFIGKNSQANAEDTVSTLTVEGLAYIPPAFVNEVRYYSRRTPTAEWQTLNYDAGRYAFCAVNVSDCLDVNRLVADSARSSSDNMRITLARCFEDTSHTGYTLDPKAWDDFMKNYDDGSDSNVPLVSVADLNLAVGEKKPGGLDALSPFCAYLKQSNNAKFVTDNTDGNKTVELQRNLAFVTDSCFAATNRTSDAINLARGDDQPFAGLAIAGSDDETKNDDTVGQLFRLKSRFLTKYGKNIQRPERIQLYDYLDRDSVPLSLAMPTVERTPMVTGVRLVGRMSLTLGDVREKTVDLPGGTGASIAIKARDLVLNVADFKAQASFVYPFKYDHGTRPKFKAQAAATITFVKAGAERSLRLEEPLAPAIFAYENWSQSAKPAKAEKYGSEATPVVVTMQSAPESIEDVNNKKIVQEEDAILETLNLQLSDGAEIPFVGKVAQSGILSGVTLPDEVANTTFLTAQRMRKDPTTGQVTSDGEPVFFTSFRPSKSGLDGVVDEFSSGERCVPVIQLWVRILDENDEVVDLVPACYKDDAEPSSDLARLSSATERPLVRFFTAENSDDSVTIVNAKEMMDFKGNPFDFFPKAYLADDPRFNYAPECLVATKGLGDDFKKAWFNQQRSTSRDGDIFMTTSDAGYLQSINELVFLVNSSGMGGNGSDDESGESAVNTSAFDGGIRYALDGLAAGNAMWRTYTHKAVNENFDVISGDRGFRINPYTEDANILMNALADTPVDWWACSTNFENVADAKKKMAGKVVRGRNTVDLKEGAKYTFSEFAEDGKGVRVKHGTRRDKANSLLEVAESLKSTFRGATGGNWQNVFDNVNWSEEDRICGVDLGTVLHSVDKKYLHGFWRDCFANRQHLFLIFVRAEPMMMGGGGLGHTPPQLGARAVGLVWRDPTPNKKDPNGPHRTRLVFYRQFD